MFARLLVCHCGATMGPARKHYRTAGGVDRTWTGYTCPGARYVRSMGIHRRQGRSKLLVELLVQCDPLFEPLGGETGTGGADS